MLLHIGGDFVINTDDIVGVFDLDNITVTERGAEFVNKAEIAESIIYVDDNLPKALVVTNRDEGNMIFITSLAASTLIKRLESRYTALR